MVRHEPERSVPILDYRLAQLVILQRLRKIADEVERVERHRMSGIAQQPIDLALRQVDDSGVGVQPEPVLRGGHQAADRSER